MIMARNGRYLSQTVHDPGPTSKICFGGGFSSRQNRDCVPSSASFLHPR
jgi:hypothetical protein